MTPEFEWIRRPFKDPEGDTVIRHYLVDPCGQVRADVDEPQNGRLSYVADLYWASESKYSNWISLDLAKAHVEMKYRALLANNFTKRKRAKRDLQKTQTTRHRRGPAEKGNQLG